jgi:hypothetical protein
MARILAVMSAAVKPRNQETLTGQTPTALE